MADTNETKPDVKDKKPDMDGRLTVKVRDSEGVEILFKIKKTTRFEKVMAAYTQKVGGTPGSYKFLFDGERINEDNTPESLEMNDMDVVDAMIAQVGG